MRAWALAVAAVGVSGIKIMVDDYVLPEQDKNMKSKCHYLEVSEQITVRDLLDKVNFFGDKLENEAHTPVAMVGAHKGTVRGQPVRPNEPYDLGQETWYARDLREPYHPDNGIWLFKHWTLMQQAEMEYAYVYAHYNGKALNPASTLASNGIAEMSTVLLRKAADVGVPPPGDAPRRQITVSVNGRQGEWKPYFYAREDLWNIFNVICHHYGFKLSNMEFEVKGHGEWVHKSDYWRVKSTRMDDGYDIPTLGKGYPSRSDGQMEMMGDPNFLGMVKQIEVIVHPSSECDCLSGSDWSAQANKFMPTRWSDKNYGNGCSAHDAQHSKACKGKNIAKGNRICWCSKKWCYVDPKCGKPSVKFPEMHYSYDACENEIQEDCFATDSEGAEGALLDDFDIWTFGQVQAYLQSLTNALVDSNEKFKDAYNKAG